MRNCKIPSKNEVHLTKKKFANAFHKNENKNSDVSFFPQTDVIQLMKSSVSHFVNFCAWMRHSVQYNNLWTSYSCIQWFEITMASNKRSKKSLVEMRSSSFQWCGVFVIRALCLSQIINQPLE